MVNLSQNGFTHNQILKFLKSEEGIRSVNYRLDVTRSGILIREAKYIDCSIECKSDENIKYSASITIEPNDLFNWRTDRIVPVIHFAYQGSSFEYPLVPMRAETVSHEIHDGYTLLKIEAFDELMALKNNSFGYVPYFSAGTIYTTAIAKILQDIGFEQTNIYPSNKAMQTDREDWSEDSNILETLNGLLDEIGYRSLAVNRDGIVYSSEYEEPGIATAEIHYNVGKDSVIQASKTLEFDSYNKPNRFVGIVNNPDLEEPLRYVYENSDPSSPISTVNRYSVTQVVAYDSIADIETLAANIIRLAADVSADYEYATLTTANMPHHELWEDITIQSNGVSGVYQETGWTMDFKKGGTMKHNLRRRVY